MTHASENITLPKTFFAGGENYRQNGSASIAFEICFKHTHTLEFLLNESVEFEKYFLQIKLYSNLLPPVLQTRMLPQHQEDSGNREDPLNEHYSCFSDL